MQYAHTHRITFQAKHLTYLYIVFFMCRYPENLSKILQGKIHMQYIAALLDMSVTT